MWYVSGRTLCQLAQTVINSIQFNFSENSQRCQRQSKLLTAVEYTSCFSVLSYAYQDTYMIRRTHCSNCDQTNAFARTPIRRNTARCSLHFVNPGRKVDSPDSYHHYLDIFAKHVDPLSFNLPDPCTPLISAATADLAQEPNDASFSVDANAKTNTTLLVS